MLGMTYITFPHATVWPEDTHIMALFATGLGGDGRLKDGPVCIGIYKEGIRMLTLGHLLHLLGMTDRAVLRGWMLGNIGIRTRALYRIEILLIGLMAGETPHPILGMFADRPLFYQFRGHILRLMTGHTGGRVFRYLYTSHTQGHYPSGSYE